MLISGGPLLAALTGLPAGWLVDRVGAITVVRLGLLLMSGAAALLAVLSPALGPLGYLLPILLLTAGYALFQTANNSAVIGGSGGHPRGRGRVADPGAQSGSADGARRARRPVCWSGGRGDPVVASASELHFAMQASFALSGVLLLAALAGGKRPVQCAGRSDPGRLRVGRVLKTKTSPQGGVLL